MLAAAPVPQALNGGGTMTDSDQATPLTETELRAAIGEPMELAVQKVRPALDEHSKAFIARAPFLCLGTSGADGRADVSPRGDQPGFVQVLDDHTLFIPDRPGNNRLDSMRNIAENPNVGLLFMIPGYEDTLRVNGKATMVRDPALLEAAKVNGRTPKVGIQIAVEEAFLHCAKALKRARLWDPASRQDRREMPSLAKMILEQVAPPDRPPSTDEVNAADDFVEDNYRTGLY
jgi:PPOX class probable FMN-dependent enzyme